MFAAISLTLPAVDASVLSRAVPINFWLLQRGRESMEADVELCAACCASADAAALSSSLEALTARPGVAVEIEAMVDHAPRESKSWSSTELAEEITQAGPRSFLLPGAALATVNELDFADGGTGARVWDAAIAMSIWLTHLGERVLREKTLLELGAGVGLCGITAALAGADATLSELGERLPSSVQQVSGGAVTTCSTAPLLPNLQANLRSNGLSSSPEAEEAVATSRGTARTLALNWESCMEDEYEAPALYDVVVGSDLVYEGFAVEALIAALMAHTARGGVAYLMSASTRFSKSGGALTLLKALKAEGTVKLEPMTIHNSHGRTRVLLVEWIRAE